MTLHVFLRKYIWFIVLIGVAIYFIVFHFGSSTFNPSNKEFAIADTSEITSIIISNDSLQINLSKTPKGWVLNDYYSTRYDAIKAILNVVSHINTGVPIPKAVKDSLSEELDLKGIKVVIKKGDKEIKSYSLQSTRTLNLGSYGRLYGTRMMFTLQIPGYKGDISSLFELDADYWKSNRLIIAEINQMVQIEVEIPNNPEKSFSLSIDKNGIHLKATYFDQEVKNFDPDIVENFIYGLSNLSFEKLLNESSEERAAIILSQPDQIFTITLANGNKLVLKTYPIPVDEYRDEFGRTVKFDLNRLYISFKNDEIIAIASYTVFDPVLKDLASFRIKN